MFSIKAWLFIGAIAASAMMAASGYAAWSLSQHFAEKKIEQVRQEMQQFLMKERQITDHYQNLADTSYHSIMESLADIAATSSSVATGLEQAREKNPEYFNQDVPKEGKELWLKSRSLMYP